MHHRFHPLAEMQCLQMDVSIISTQIILPPVLKESSGGITPRRNRHLECLTVSWREDKGTVCPRVYFCSLASFGPNNDGVWGRKSHYRKVGGDLSFPPLSS